MRGVCVVDLPQGRRCIAYGGEVLGYSYPWSFGIISEFGLPYFVYMDTDIPVRRVCEENIEVPFHYHAVIHSNQDPYKCQTGRYQRTDE